MYICSYVKSTAQGVQRLSACLYLPKIDSLPVPPVMYKVSVLMWVWSGVTCLSIYASS